VDGRGLGFELLEGLEGAVPGAAGGIGMRRLARSTWK
jgi:hypothetical protein